MASQKTNFNVRFTVTAVVVVGIIVFLNALVGTVDTARFDLTDDQIYTVSPAAKRVLGELKVPVQVKLYMTDKDEMPTGLQTLERDLVDKLSEFAVISDGNVEYSVVDPSEDEELKEKIANKGIRPFQVQTVERDAMGIKLVYSAMEISYLDKDPEVLPQILPQSLETFEYDVCAAISRLTRDMDPVVAVYASKQQIDPQMMQMYLQMGQQPPEPPEVYGNAMELLRGQAYDVRRVQITEDSPIPEEASTLVLLAPRSLNERQLYEINRFVQMGGSVIVAVQNYEFQYAPSRQGGFTFTPQPVNPGIEPLLDGWGVTVSDAVLMDSNMEVLGIPSTRNVGGFRMQVSEPVQAPMHIKVTQDQFVADTSITNGVGDLLYLWGSRLEIDHERLAEAGIEPITLFTTSGDTWEIDWEAGPLTRSSLISDPDSDLSREPLAVLMRGEIPNVYPTGNKPQWPGGAASDTTDAGPEPVEEFVPVESSLVVLGDAKMFEDSFLQMVPGNSMLLLNAVDALTLGDDIIEIRARTMTQRTIEPLSDQAKLGWRFFAVGLVPLAVAAYGIFRSVRRRREEAAFLAAQRAA
jgi:ABC-type uncharacterized transport system involved in gliding motility auxiliary subunit